jgi:hypothetical protein
MNTNDTSTNTSSLPPYSTIYRTVSDPSYVTGEDTQAEVGSQRTIEEQGRVHSGGSFVIHSNVYNTSFVSKQSGGHVSATTRRQQQQKQAPTWGNCRLLLSQDAEDALRRSCDVHDLDSSQQSLLWPEHGVIARLYFSSQTHPVIRQVLHDFEFKHVSVAALAVQNLMNNRGPDALVGHIPGEKVHSYMLKEMCVRCHEEGMVLVSRTKDVDVVLVPRDPKMVVKDSLYFVVYATNIKAVELCEALRKDKQVAVVLDVDNTLVDATRVESDGGSSLEWIHTEVKTSSGEIVGGAFAHVPGSECGDARQDRAFMIHWSRHGVDFMFHVRVRRGWGTFRAFLLDNRNKFMTFLCSKGKREYVELIWQGLDPGSRIIPKDDWHRRVSSTYPDTLDVAAHKTALIALSCSTVHDQYAETHLAAPYICIDDCPDTYEEPYRSSVLLVEEYAPSMEHGKADTGEVMEMIMMRLDQYWEATCGELGTFAWQAAQSFSTAILGAMQRTVMESPDALQYLQVRCAKQGELLWRQITVEYVLPGASASVYSSKPEAKDDGNVTAWSPVREMRRASIQSQRHSVDIPRRQQDVSSSDVVIRGSSLSPEDRSKFHMMMQC